MGASGFGTAMCARSSDDRHSGPLEESVTALTQSQARPSVKLRCGPSLEGRDQAVQLPQFERVKAISPLKALPVRCTSAYGVRKHRYTVVNGRTVSVKPRTRRVVEIVTWGVLGDGPFRAASDAISPWSVPATCFG